MNTKHFEAIGRYQPGSATIDLYGDLTVHAAEALDAAYTALASQNPGVIFFNFAGVDYLNSTGIALLISLVARARQSSHTLMAYGLRPFHAELFQLAGLHAYMPILSDENVIARP
ncbi:MAG: anti-sigma factor antagonist [Anaerolineae bacterium]|nr:STAS domain-containing protein [Anaerolineales bacterium]MCQ3972605.1 anti-sigma factor antagonist [Anaerolineae bacterium]